MCKSHRHVLVLCVLLLWVLSIFVVSFGHACVLCTCLHVHARILPFKCASVVGFVCAQLAKYGFGGHGMRPSPEMALKAGSGSVSQNVFALCPVGCEPVLNSAFAFVFLWRCT